MNKKNLVLALLLLPMFVIGQEVSIGAKLLVADLYYFSRNDNGSFNYLEPDYKLKPDFGIAIGISNFSKKIPLEAGLQYTRLRTKHNLLEDGIEGSIGSADALLPWVADDLTVKLDYFFFNINYAFQLSEKLKLSVGPQIGYLIFLGKEGSAGSEGFTDLFEAENHLDYGLNLNLTFDVTSKLSANLEGYNGFVLVEEALVPDPSGARNRYFAFGLSYRVFSF